MSRSVIAASPEIAKLSQLQHTVGNGGDDHDNQDDPLSWLQVTAQRTTPQIASTTTAMMTTIRADSMPAKGLRQAGCHHHLWLAIGFQVSARLNSVLASTRFAGPHALTSILPALAA